MWDTDAPAQRETELARTNGNVVWTFGDIQLFHFMAGVAAGVLIEGIVAPIGRVAVLAKKPA